ncbi:hypothetical protein Bpfe_008618 [Biomphalaria pfeifferi]|uniref:Uncharacterized protein n=1 Tax=Biomphalaria pfeifferi TaxID=112525 RepID=A0AAD8BWZ9_BIOPF|nr:hypothetical protein Bpfe_008618 [Biomphalaria pfeifferi]
MAETRANKTKRAKRVTERGDLNKYRPVCKKNPGHELFIPVPEFTVNNLPEGFRDSNIYEAIRALADLTVRIDVTYTSPDRPEFYPGTDAPYPFYHERESHVMRTGSGWVEEVRKYGKADNKACPCFACQQLPTPSKVWGECHVVTAALVVFDDVEARHTTCRVGFDSSTIQGVNLDGVQIVTTDIAGDRCVFSCVTHDIALIDRLEKTMDLYETLDWKVNSKYFPTKDKHKVAIIVSHPHGCAKQVSIGKWIYRLDLGKDRTKYTYNTCTCPGSTGAPVYILGRDGGISNHNHSGANADGNYSGTWQG